MKIIISFFTSLFLSFIFTKILILFNKRNNIVERVREDRWHKHQVGKFGGIALLLSFLIANIIFSNLEVSILVLIFATLSFFLGLIDDILEIKPQIKMLYVIILAITNFYFGFKFMPSLPVYLTLPLTIFWFSGIINSVNLVDNLDGLSSGISIIALSTISFYLFSIQDFDTLQISIILIGSCLGFIIFNFPPAKIFMGDSGSFFLGTCLAILCLKLTSELATGVIAAFLIPVMIMIIPIFDTTFVSVNRYFKNIPLSKGGLDHSSHSLVKLGFTNRQTILILFCISLSFGAIVVLSNIYDYRWWIPILIILLICLCLLGIFLSYYKQDMIYVNKKVEQKNNELIRRVYLYKKQLIEMVIDSFLIGGAFTISHLLRFENNISNQIWIDHDKLILIFVLIKILTFYICGLYRGLWKYASVPDLIRVFKSCLTGSVIIVICIFFINKELLYSRSLLIIDFLITFIFISGFRLFYRILLQILHLNTSINKNNKRVLFIGLSEYSINVLRLITDQNYKNNFYVVGLIGLDHNYLGRLILNTPVLGKLEQFDKIIKEHEIELVINSEDTNLSDEIKSFCNDNGILYHVPKFDLN
jgi:UDP-GlcNAc:undecaprenyl-phosphate/decaprenyl-phosphate GlcNAc-1-phosphate transferase